MNNWQYAHSSPQSSRRVFIRPGNDYLQQQLITITTGFAH